MLRDNTHHLRVYFSSLLIAVPDELTRLSLWRCVVWQYLVCNIVIISVLCFIDFFICF